MKSIKLTFLICLIFSGVQAQQDFIQSLEGIEWVKVESKGNILIIAHSKSQLLIKSGDTQKIPERAKGLKLVGENGTDNTGAGFYVTKDGSNLIVRNLRKSGISEIYLPTSQNVSVSSFQQGDIEISGFSSEIEVSSLEIGKVKIKDITGPVTADSQVGDIEVVFSKVNQTSPISISSEVGEVDVTLPSDTPAELSLQSSMGEIYTNFDLSVPDKDGLKAISTQKVNGSINNGGVRIQLNSAVGNIYLRKK